MKIRSLLMAAAVLTATATSGFAALSPAKVDWGRGPVQYLMTNEEKAAWKALQTDADADAFIELFWARRDPTPATPRNEFREEFDASVKAADSQFSHGRKKGSMTDPGRVLIVFGAPTTAKRTTTPGTGQQNTRQDMRNAEIGSAMTSSGSADMTWTYEAALAQKAFGLPRLDVTFHDQYGEGDFKLATPMVDANSAMTQKMIASFITQPGLTKAPTFQAASAAPVVPPPPAAAATTLKTAALESAVVEAKGGKGNNHGAALAYAELMSPAGEPFIPVAVYVPASAGVAADGADTIFGAVEDASGKRVTMFEEP
ncbi:MAG TPA: GWxTD domain-containing protein, partial [Thermoanaerobaculia bacterium]|nr:GWxTD domain-containing protein [Thermoanaerobaculia bacterium]